MIMTFSPDGFPLPKIMFWPMSHCHRWAVPWTMGVVGFAGVLPNLADILTTEFTSVCRVQPSLGSRPNAHTTVLMP